MTNEAAKVQEANSLWIQSLCQLSLLFFFFNRKPHIFNSVQSLFDAVTTTKKSVKMPLGDEEENKRSCQASPLEFGGLFSRGWMGVVCISHISKFAAS